MKNPFTVNPSSLEFLLCPPIRLAQADSDRENISWTEEQCQFTAHAINQHDKLVAMLRQTCVFECPVCQKTVGHADGCGLAALLKEVET